MSHGNLEKKRTLDFTNLIGLFMVCMTLLVKKSGSRLAPQGVVFCTRTWHRPAWVLQLACGFLALSSPPGASLAAA